MAKHLITLKESAKFLRLNEKALNEIIKFNKFKIYKKGNVQKLDKNEIIEWLANLVEKEQKDLAITRIVCRFVDYIKPKNIFLGFEASNKFDAIAEVAQKAKDLKIVKNYRWLYEAIIAREDIVSTAMGKGVAFLHARAFHPSKIKTPSIIFAKSKTGIDFDALDGKPVNLFFLLLLHNEKQHLFCINYISRFMLNPKNIELLYKIETEKEIYNLLTYPENIF